MNNKQESSSTFFIGLFQQMSPSYLIALAIPIVYIYLMQFADHAVLWTSYLVVIIALIKTFYFTFFTFKQVNKSIKKCHSFTQLLWIFGLLVFLIILSYSADYTCLFAADSNSFEGLKSYSTATYFNRLFDFFYFSVVTFASVGYGDIVPVSISAKLIVMLEIGQSFVLVVFGLSNINNIRMLKNDKT